MWTCGSSDLGVFNEGDAFHPACLQGQLREQEEIDGVDLLQKLRGAKLAPGQKDSESGKTLLLAQLRGKHGCFQGNRLSGTAILDLLLSLAKSNSGPVPRIKEVHQSGGLKLCF